MPHRIPEQVDQQWRWRHLLKYTGAVPKDADHVRTPMQPSDVPVATNLAAARQTGPLAKQPRKLGPWPNLEQR